VSGFYAPRWAAWLARLRADLDQARPYDAAAWRLECLRLTHAWVAACDGASLPLEPSGDAVALAGRALDAWGGLASAPLLSPPAAALAAPPAPAAEAAPELAAAAAAVGVAAAAAVAMAAAEAPLSPVRATPAQVVRA
jgi:hypothetical protein